tara:strand:- start:4556 stop:6334 length:1779 start_codon:yes stop_codon:yes gene_type:complete
MYGIKLTTLLTILILTTSTSVNSETATSGNLLPNAGAGQSNSQNSTDAYTPDRVGSSQYSGWTITNGGQLHTNEFEVKGQGSISDDGTLLGITTTKQNGGSFTTTTDSLDGGVRLDGVTEIQNCEWNASSYRCGGYSTGGGARDTFSTTIKITDANDNVLGVTTFTRNNDAGYGHQSFTYTDSITHNGTGARNYEWEWQGTDGSDPNHQGLIGPNLLGASLTATLLDIDYTAITITEETQAELDLTNELLEEAQEDLTEKLKVIEEINLTQLEEIETLEFVPEIKELELQEININELKIEQLETMFVQNFKEVLVKENLTQEFETALVQENITEEEFFEEVGNMMKEELNIQETPKETKMEETNVITEKPMEEETIKEEKIEETNTEESNASNSNSTEPEPNNTETIKEDETSSESEPKASENTEEKSTESSVDEDTKTEGEETETTNEEKLDADETGTTKETDVDSGDEKNIASSISAKVEKIIKKLENTLMTVDQKVKAVQFITLKAMSDNAPDMSSYKNQSFYSSRQLPDGNVDFFNQLNIEQTQIYKSVTLAKYTDNDPLTTQRIELDRIKTEENRLKIELEQLRKQL